MLRKMSHIPVQSLHEKGKVKEGASGSKVSEEGGTIYVQDYHDQLCMNAVYEMWQKKQLCDITIVAEDKDILAHKLILVARIPYFQAMLTKEWMDNGSEIVLKDVNHEALKKIVEFVYTGEIEIYPQTAEAILTTSSYLELPTIVEACERYIANHLTFDNCIGIYSFARLHNLKDLFNNVEVYITKNFSSVTESEDFVNMKQEDLLKFVAMDQIAVRSEEEVFHAVAKWLEHDPANRSEYVLLLFDHIRFPIMSLKFLRDVVSRNIMVSISQPCQAMLKQAMEYHQNPSVTSFTSPRKTLARKSFLGHICLIGGVNNDGDTLNNVDFFIPHEDQWREGTKMNCHRGRLAVALCNGHLYAIGGSQASMCLETVERYSPKFDIWEMVSPMNTPRRNCTAVVVGNLIFVLGGYNGSVFLRSVEVFSQNANSWTYQPAMIEARSELTAVFHEQHIYAMGGFNSKERLKSVERFDIVNRQWTMVANMTVPRSNFGAALLGQEIFVCGGQSTSDVLATSEIYNVEENLWESISAEMSTPRVGLAYVALGNKIYALGGSNGSEYLESAECYDPSKKEWILMSPLRDKRFSASAIVLSKQLIEDKLN